MPQCPTYSVNGHGTSPGALFNSSHWKRALVFRQHLHPTQHCPLGCSFCLLVLESVVSLLALISPATVERRQHCIMDQAKHQSQSHDQGNRLGVRVKERGNSRFSEGGLCRVMAPRWRHAFSMPNKYGFQRSGT